MDACGWYVFMPWLPDNHNSVVCVKSCRLLGHKLCMLVSKTFNIMLSTMIQSFQTVMRRLSIPCKYAPAEARCFWKFCNHSRNSFINVTGLCHLYSWPQLINSAYAIPVFLILWKWPSDEYTHNSTTAANNWHAHFMFYIRCLYNFSVLSSPLSNDFFSEQLLIGSLVLSMLNNLSGRF
jgi:hypothetical protein